MRLRMFIPSKHIIMRSSIIGLLFLIDTSSYSNQEEGHQQGGHPSVSHPMFSPSFGNKSHSPDNHPQNNRQNNTGHFQQANNQQANSPGRNRHDRNENYNNEFNPLFPIYPIVGPDYDYESVPFSDDSHDDDSYSSSDDATAQYPNGNWVSINNGNIPPYAIVYDNENGVSTYYCRAEYNGQTYYGQLIPNDGCYARDQATTIRFDTYEVLVSQS